VAQVDARVLQLVPVHDCRHFFASVRAGRSVKTVSERLGHANAAMTLNVYSHLWPQDDDHDRPAVDDIFAPDVPRMRPAKGGSAGNRR
jgi:integrase